MQFELTHLVDALPGLGWTALPDGRAEFLNKRWLDYTGMTAAEAAGSGWTEAIHPDDRTRLLQHWLACVASGTAVDTEARMRRYDGSYRWFLFRANPLRDEAGRISRWFGTNIDIDDRKKAEDALRSNERNLNLMINAIPAFIHVLSPDGSVLDVNQAVLDYTGTTLEEAQREDYRERFFHPEDVARLSKRRREGLAGVASFDLEQRVLGKDGRYRWFLVRYNPLLDDRERVDRWYAAAFDIESRKRAEAEVEQAYLRLAEAQRLSKTGSFITDLFADEHHWSDEAFRIFEFDPSTKVTMKMIRDTVHPEDLPSFDAVIAQGMTGADVDFNFRIATARGAMKHVRGMARVIEQVAGRPLFIGALQDVTQSRAAEEALNTARSELFQVSRVMALNTLTASIAHEVNQPLAGIITNASTCLRMLSGDPPNVDGARETVRRTIRDGNRAAEVINRLRALFSNKECALEPLDLNEATREVIALSVSDLQRNRVILRYELAERLPPVAGDRVQLQQVILNLIRNASDAMTGIDERPRELLIKTESDPDDQVRLSVTDAGIGFRSDSANKLFDAFYTTKKDGMGIGLSVSRSIIEAHHGFLWATPNEGPGATFSFSIPCAREPAQDLHSPNLHPPGAGAAAEHVQGN